jgi:putative endonuclease
VEVKLRKTDKFASAYEHVDPRKQNRIRTTAEIFLSEYQTDLQPRFDVIEIYAPNGSMTATPKINHMEDAF